MEDTLKVMHKHELQALLEKTDEAAEPEKYGLIKEYLDKGGYEAPTKAAFIEITRIPNKVYKTFLYVLFGFGVVEGLTSILFGSWTGLINLAVSGFGLYLIKTESKAIGAFLGVIAFLYILMTFSLAITLFYAPELTKEAVVNFVFPVVIMVYLIYGIRNYLEKAEVQA